MTQTSLTRESSLQTLDISVDALVPNPENVNTMPDVDLANLVDQIREVGFIAPIQVIPMDGGERYLILGGEHRWRAAQICGMSYVPAVVLTDAKWSDQDLIDVVAVRLNVIKGSINPEKFVKVYDRLASKFGPDKLQDVFAITDKQLWKKITKDLQTGAKNAGMPDSVVEGIGEIEKKSKSMDDFQRRLSKVFADYQPEASFGTVVVTFGNQKSVVIHATEEVWSGFKILSDFASDKRIDVNTLLEGAIKHALDHLPTGDPAV